MWVIFLDVLICLWSHGHKFFLIPEILGAPAVAGTNPVDATQTRGVTF